MATPLSRSENLKTSPVVRNRTDGLAPAYAVLMNTVGLPAGDSCPGKTDEFCKPYCYAVDSEQRPATLQKMRDNLDVLRDKTEDELYEIILEMLDDYQEDVVKYDIPPKEDIFRVHWDGDFYSIPYARAWARAIKEYPYRGSGRHTTFWVYTRSFREPVNVVPIFWEMRKDKNFAFYISVDEGNINDALEVQCDYPKIPMAFCAKDRYRAQLLADKAGRSHTFVCPENIGEIPLYENGKGACVNCMKCPNKRPNILFVDSEIPDTEYGQGVLEIPIEISLKKRRDPKFDLSLLL